MVLKSLICGRVSPRGKRARTAMRRRQRVIFVIFPGNYPANGVVGYLTAAPALQPISVGDALPSFTLKNEKDEDVDVATLTAEKGIVVFLVPKADTRNKYFASVCLILELIGFCNASSAGCTQQACGFRDIYPDFTSSGFDVYCLSADKPTAQTKWQTKVSSYFQRLSFHALVC